MTAPLQTQFQINFWKWWLIRKRHYLLFLAELIWPVILILALIWTHPLAGQIEIPNPHRQWELQKSTLTKTNTSNQLST